MRGKFINIVQRTVTKYEAQFIALAKFALEMVSTDELRCEEAQTIYSGIVIGSYDYRLW